MMQLPNIMTYFQVVSRGRIFVQLNRISVSPGFGEIQSLYWVINPHLFQFQLPNALTTVIQSI